MIWGFTLHPGEPCTKTVDKEVHLTMAALDGDVGINDATKKKCCQVLMVTESSEFLLLCTLVEGLIYQQNVDLQLMPGERVTFCAQGGRVHLTGYSQATQNANVNSNSNRRTDRQVSGTSGDRAGPRPLTLVQAHRERDVIEELFSGQDCAKPSSESRENKDPVERKKEVPQKKVENKTKENSTSLKKHSSIVIKEEPADPPMVVSELEMITSRVGDTPRQDSDDKMTVVIKEEPVDLPTIVSEPEMTTSSIEATSKQGSVDRTSEYNQEAETTAVEVGSTGRGTSRSDSPVECINQALSLTVIPSEVEDGAVTPVEKEVEIIHIKSSVGGQIQPSAVGQIHPPAVGQIQPPAVGKIQPPAGSNEGTEKRHCHQERAIAPAQAQTKVPNISPVTQIIGTQSQMRTNISLLGTIGQETQGTGQWRQGGDALFSKPLVKTNVQEAAKSYQYEVRRIISRGKQEQVKEVPSMQSLGEGDIPQGGEQPDVRTGTSTTVKAVDSHSDRKRPRPYGENEGEQNPSVSSLRPIDTNIQMKKSRIKDLRKQTERAACQSVSIPGVSIPRNTIPPEQLFQSFKLSGKEKRLQPTALKMTIPVETAQKCDCCFKLSEERHEIMLGADKHWFCSGCYTTFSADVQLLKYCRIVHQAKKR